MSLNLRIEHDDGTESTLSIIEPDDLGETAVPSLSAVEINAKIARAPDEADGATATVYRDSWADVEPSIDRRNDKAFIEEDGTDIFGGRLADWQFEGVLVSVILEDAKRDAIDGLASDAGAVYDPQNDSDILTNEILPRIPTVSAGTIETIDASAAFEESNASPGKSIAKLARDAGAEVRYQPDFTVDYVERLGSDRTTTLSPADGTVIGEPRIREKTREDVTHVLVLGANEGRAQIRVERVSDRYDGGRVSQRQFADKDIQRQSRAETLADELLAEYDGDPEWLEVELELPQSVNPNLGDSFPVSLSEYGIDTTLRIMELRRIIDEAGDRFAAILSNRKLTRERSGQRQSRNVDELSGGNAGQYIADSHPEGWDAFGPNAAYQFGYDRPANVIDEGELRAVLRVESRPYRLRSSQTSHSHSVSIPDHDHSVSIPDHRHSVSISDTSTANTNTTAVDESTSTLGQETVGDGWTTIESYTPSASGTTVPPTFAVVSQILVTWTDDENIKFRLKNTTTGEVYRETIGYGPDLPPIELIGIAPDDISGETVEWQGDAGTDTVVTYSGYYQSWGTHTHDVSDSATTSDGGATTETTSDGGGTTETTDATQGVSPGINEIGSETASNVDISVGGTTVASGLDHPIDERIDISGELEAGSNPIEATTDSLGELRITVEYEALVNASQ